MPGPIVRGNSETSVASVASFGLLFSLPMLVEPPHFRALALVGPTSIDSSDQLLLFPFPFHLLGSLDCRMLCRCCPTSYVDELARTFARPRASKPSDWLWSLPTFDWFMRTLFYLCFFPAAASTTHCCVLTD
mmetsp:Transcript_56162/g.132331  ORF Transcript_56162/g.132331 Transcript_56162/m.132331 type:complete len:132 (+) Transcript_56162:257-652(+)